MTPNLMIEAVFHQAFKESYHTLLCGGGDEPFYQAPKDGDSARIIYRDNYEASALHEIAHWTVAGAKRREQDDYGYWYEPDGRTEETQTLFAAVEARPQAVEWFITRAAGLPFRVSMDNLNTQVDSAPFKDAVYRALLDAFDQHFPPRAVEFATALCNFRHCELPSVEQFSRAELDQFYGENA